MKPVRQSDFLETILAILNMSVATPERIAESEPENPLDILLAEDNAINQMVMVGLLKKAGHAVTVVENGKEAMEKLVHNDYDVVLMDVQMPVQDGLVTTEAIRAADSPVKNRGIPILALTAHALKEDTERCLAVGMNDIITKPVYPQVLFTKLHKWAGKNEAAV